MSRWNTQPLYYLTDPEGRVVIGPFPGTEPGVALINRLTPGLDYWNASRYQLAKGGHYPRTKAGEEALRLDEVRCGVAERLRALLGRPSFVHGYPQADWTTIDTLLAAAGLPVHSRQPAHEPH